MFKKIIPKLSPMSTIILTPKFYFARNFNPSPKDGKNISKKYFVLDEKSRYLQKKIMKEKKGKGIEEDKSEKFQSQIPNFRFHKYQFDLGNNKKSSNQILPFIIALFVLYLWNGEDKQQSSNIRYRQEIPEKKLLELISGGTLQQQIMIIREKSFVSINGNRKYSKKTVCHVKQKGRNQSLKCTISDLTSFLQHVQNTPLNYNVDFIYDAYSPIESSDNTWVIQLTVAALIGIFILKRKKNTSQGDSTSFLNQMTNNKKFVPIKAENINTMFKDVAGMHQAKKQIVEFVDFLKSPDKYIEMGAKIPKGALLTGPPGTGKTMIARACAGEAGVPFFYVSGSEFVEKYVGLGANRIRSLFESASKAAPSIIFIDEIDAIGKKRNTGPFANEQKENTLNQLLVNMDGFETKNQVIVMAATNIKDSLDPALLRPGRFDRAIEIGLPSFQQRVQILKVHLVKVKYTSLYSLEEIAKKISILTPGFSGAELANICNEAAILAARKNKLTIDIPEFEKATERVMAGLEKRNMFSEEEKQCLAYYECGKAIIRWFTEGAEPVIKISIAPFSKSAKGYSHTIKDQIPLKTKTELFNQVVCLLAGRAAQHHFKGYITSNGDSDLKRAKRIISVMVIKFGMSQQIGKVGFPDIQYVRKPYSEGLESIIDIQITKMYDKAQSLVEKTIKERIDLIQILKAKLMEKETLSHDQIEEILGKRATDDNQNYNKYMKGKEEDKERQIKNDKKQKEKLTKDDKKQAQAIQ